MGIIIVEIRLIEEWVVKENNFNKSNAFDSVAQGTIEYLVIIAVVVVLSLVVVILMLNQASTVSEADQKMTNLRTAENISSLR